ncbi:MAG: ComEC/Rec2 family competence protein [Patescibacteria group bacterium]|jgi:competence protein ComEC
MRLVYYLIFLVILCSIYLVLLFAKLAHVDQNAHQTEFEGTITVVPEVKPRSIQFKVGDIEVVSSKNVVVELGDRLRLIGRPQKRVINSIYNEYLLIYPEIIVLKKFSDLSLKERLVSHPFLLAKQQAYLLQTKISRQYKLLFSKTNESIVAGMVLGQKNNLSTEVYNSLQVSGLIHLIVASGGNVAMISSILMILLHNFVSHRSKLVITYLFIFFYLLIVGFEPPLVRASILVGLTWLGTYFGRKTSSFWVLCIVGLAMLIVEPLLLFSLSFQLSFAATVGIVAFGKTINTLIGHFLKHTNQFLIQFLSATVSQTIAAQAFTIPLSMAVFGNFNIFSFLANVLVAPVVAPITYGGVLLLIVSLVSIEVAFFIAWIITILPEYLLWIAEIFSKIPIGSINFNLSWTGVMILWMGISLFGITISRYVERIETKL